jgi:hypothetical protein
VRLWVGGSNEAGLAVAGRRSLREGKVRRSSKVLDDSLFVVRRCRRQVLQGCASKGRSGGEWALVSASLGRHSRPCKLELPDSASLRGSDDDVALYLYLELVAA